MAVTQVVVGVDVGGTNTDAVLLDGHRVLSKAKTHTTSDVRSGVRTAIHRAILNTQALNLTLGIKHVNIGTTHFINALIEGKNLSKVAVIRLCGTASRKLPPFSDVPQYLNEIIKGHTFMVKGGYEFDGRIIDDVDEQEIITCIQKLKERGERNIVVCGIFSPLRNEQEIKVYDIIHKEYPEASITLSHKIGKLGLLERENAAILNEAIKPLCSETIKGFRETLDDLGLRCPMYLTQNDGTVISEDNALHYPVFTFASGSTNSMRGAAFLSGLKTAIVVDIGGTSTDVGVLFSGFPKYKSSEVHIGGIRTNFRMPDVISIGLGGGSYVRQLENGNVRIGPLSAGYQIQKEALVFASSVNDTTGRFVTATDLVVAGGFVCVGNKDNVAHLDKDFVASGINTMHDMLTQCIDEIRLSATDLPLILVGGGSIIVDPKSTFEGVSRVIYPEHFDVANAVGAALSQISFTIDKVVDLGQYLPPSCSSATEIPGEKQIKEALLKARQEAMSEAILIAEKETIAAGATEDSLITVEKEHTTLAYIPGNAVRIQVKVVGDLRLETDLYASVPDLIFRTEPIVGTQSQKQSVSGTGKILSNEKSVLKIKKPIIDASNGEWIINDYDIECITIGAGILGCGGGGNPHIGRILALNAYSKGQKMRIVTPSKFAENAHPENDRVALVAFMGAPLAIYERLVAENETTSALQCMRDLLTIGEYKEGELKNTKDVDVKTGNGVIFIDDYKPQKGNIVNTDCIQKNIVGVMSAEIGGMNCIEPLIVGAELGLPIIDCDGMGRAFPELQMFSPFIYGCNPYPCALSDHRGRRAVVLKAESPKAVENHFRDVVIQMGCSGGITLSTYNKTDVLTRTVQHSVSHAWRIGDAILRARADNRSPVEALVKLDNGVVLIYGKIVDVLRETTGGFNKGNFTVMGLDHFAGKKIEIDFQNEFLLALDVCGEKPRVVACTPDLITCLDADTAQPIATEEIRFGIRVCVVGLSINPLMSQPEALQVVGPTAFGYPSDAYSPLGTFVDHGPIGPM